MASTDPPRFLLLLPPAPSPPTAAALKSAFGETVSQVLKEVATHSAESSKAAVLEIALACPHLIGKRKTPRSSLYAETQSLVAGIYKAVCIVAAKDGINVEDADGVDVRVLLVNWSHGSAVIEEYAYGPIVSLESLARSGRSWQFAFGVESEAGEAMMKAFVAAKGSGEEVVSVHSDSGTATKASSAAVSAGGKDQDSGQTSGQFHAHVAVGGTFDHIHIGHKLLLTMTVFAVDDNSSNESRERSATIGITGDQLLLKKKHREVLESWEDRYRATIAFISAIVDFSPESAGQPHVSIRNEPGPNGKSMDVHYSSGLVVKCTEIQDPFGPTITEEQISALIISAETRSGGKAVNDKREEKGWKPLEVFEVDVLDAEDEGEDDGKLKEGFESKLSSTSIREKLARKYQSSL